MTFFSTIGSNQHLTFFSGGKLAEMVNVHEAKTHLSRLLDEVHAGKEIILAKGGPTLCAVVAPRSQGLGATTGSFEGGIGGLFF